MFARVWNNTFRAALIAVIATLTVLFMSAFAFAADSVIDDTNDVQPAASTEAVAVENTTVETPESTPEVQAEPAAEPVSSDYIDNAGASEPAQEVSDDGYASDEEIVEMYTEERDAQAEAEAAAEDNAAEAADADNTEDVSDEAAAETADEENGDAAAEVADEASDNNVEDADEVTETSDEMIDETTADDEAGDEVVDEDTEEVTEEIVEDTAEDQIEEEVIDEDTEEVTEEIVEDTAEDQIEEEVIDENTEEVTEEIIEEPEEVSEDYIIEETAGEDIEIESEETAGEGSAEEETAVEEAPAAAVKAQATAKAADPEYKLKKVNGTLYVYNDGKAVTGANQWVTVEGKKYRIDSKGHVYTNCIVNVGEAKYYVKADGTTGDAGWLTYKGNKYYCNSKGGIFLNRFIDVKSNRYFMDANGALVYGPFRYNGDYFVSNDSGVVSTSKGWVTSGGKRYYSAKDGTIYRGRFISVNGTYYYMTSTGAAISKGWATIEGVKYYFNSDGSRAVNKVITDSSTVKRYVGSDGKIVTSKWVTENGKKYYAASNGLLKVNTVASVNKHAYYFGSDGTIQYGIVDAANGYTYYADPKTGYIETSAKWVTYDGNKYLIKKGGAVYTNTLYVNHGRPCYYFNDEGKLVKGTFKYNGKYYCSSAATGTVIIKAGWITYRGKRYLAKEGGELYTSRFINYGGKPKFYVGADGAVVESGAFKANGKFYFADKNGEMVTDAGWVTDANSKRYYINSKGNLNAGTFATIAGKRFYFGSDAAVSTGVFEVGSTLYYADTKGIIKTTSGWIEYKGNKYFAKEGGALYRNQYISFNGKKYWMGYDGAYNSSSGKLADFVKIAQSQVGATTGQKYWKWYFGSSFVSGDATPWCAAFVSWCATQAGLSNGSTNFKNFAYCPTGIANFQNSNSWYYRTSGYTPKAGDVIFFRGGAHVGLVESVTKSGGTTYVNTIEGNTGSSYYGECARRVYSMANSAVYGFGLIR